MAPSLVSDAGAVVGYHTTVWIAPPPIGFATVKRVNPDWRVAGASAAATVASKSKKTTEWRGRARRYRARSGPRSSLADMTNILREHEVARFPQQVGCVLLPPCRSFGTALREDCDGGLRFHDEA